MLIFVNVSRALAPISVEGLDKLLKCAEEDIIMKNNSAGVNLQCIPWNNSCIEGYEIYIIEHRLVIPFQLDAAFLQKIYFTEPSRTMLILIMNYTDPNLVYKTQVLVI